MHNPHSLLNNNDSVVSVFIQQRPAEQHEMNESHHVDFLRPRLELLVLGI